MSSQYWPIEPSYPWSAVVEVPVHPYTLEQLQAITASLGITPHPVFDMQLERAARHYFANATRSRGYPPNPKLLRNQANTSYENDETIKERKLARRPTSAERRAKLMTLAKQAGKLLKALELDDASRSEFTRSQADPAEAFRLLDLLTEKTTELCWRLYGLRKPLKVKDVRTPDEALEGYILTLEGIYAHATGKHMARAHPNGTTKDGGPFLRFVTACLTPIDPERGNIGLGDFVKRMKRYRHS